MFDWILRFVFAGVGTILSIMVKVLSINPIFYILPLAVILMAFVEAFYETKSPQVQEHKTGKKNKK